MADTHPSDPGCIFCKIVAGTIPCHTLYQDDDVLSFLDVGPLSDGHCLIIPKGHYVTLDQVPADIAGKCAALATKLGKAAVDAVSAEGWNLLQNNGKVAGQAVDHVHFHIIPRNDGDALGYRWPAGQLAEDDAKRLIDDITRHLAS